jgi:3-phytase
MKTRYIAIVSGLGLVLCAGPLLSQETADPIKPVAPEVKCLAPNARDQDDMCIWVHPKDRAQSTIITSDKHADMVFVYDLDGKAIQSIPVRYPGNIDLCYSFPLGGRSVDIVAFNQQKDYLIRVYQVNAATRQLERVDNGAIRTSGKTSGGALYRSPKSGRSYFVATTTKPDAPIEQFELADDGTGQIGGKKVRSWRLGAAEAAVADDETGNLYIAEEHRGVWELGGEPDDPAPGRLIIELGQNGLVGDIEGLALYDLPGGDNYLIVSNQGADNFKVYQRAAPHRFIGTFAVEGAKHTDGLEVCNANLGPRFPKGIFVCHTANKETSAGRPVLVTPWEAIAKAMPGELTIYTEWEWRSWVARLSPAGADSRE